MTLEGAPLLGASGTCTTSSNLFLNGPKGPQPLIYADHVASGRADEIVESVISRRILPFYANTHSEDSYCGEHTTRMHEDARRIVHQQTGARQNDIVVFAGSGMTGALAVLMHELSLGPKQMQSDEGRTLVVVGPYEHHSNLLPWRESGADVVEISEALDGGPDLEHLDRVLSDSTGYRRIIGSFGVASNVTGILTDVGSVSRRLHRAGAIAVWDYAAAAPYVDIAIDNGPREDQPDAIVFSPHKFKGGPGASGVLVADRSLFRTTAPRHPGGGTVSFVSPWAHDYSDDPVIRNEAGTPNILGDIRAALVLLLKAGTPQKIRDAKLLDLSLRPLSRWQSNPAIMLLGNLNARRLPTFSFCVRRKDGSFFDHSLFACMLSDLYGIQTRAGCACAGPYGHRLLNIDELESSGIRKRIATGNLSARPGFVRLALTLEMSEETVSHIIDSVDELASTAETLESDYRCDRDGFLHNGDLRGSIPSLRDYFHQMDL